MSVKLFATIERMRREGRSFARGRKITLWAIKLDSRDKGGLQVAGCVAERAMSFNGRARIRIAAWRRSRLERCPWI